MPKPNPFYDRLQSTGPPRRFRLSLLSGLYALNHALGLSERWTQVLWTLIVVETFYIDGGCQHSGMCCKGIMLYQGGHPLNRVASFQDACQNDPSFSRFMPNADSDQQISSYNCSCLGEDHRCTDYQNRPDLCHAYPYSYFLDEGRLHLGCGYRVLLRIDLNHFKYSSLRQRLQKIALQIPCLS